jgi:hypothetical protein
MPGWRVVADDPEMWASILGWHCWRGAAGIWHARRMVASPAAALRAASLDTLRACIDHQNSQQCPGRPGCGFCPILRRGYPGVAGLATALPADRRCP